MKVVFLENFSEWGYLAWDIVEVKDWFARNFLIPKKIALPATEKIIAWTEDLRKKWEEIREAMRNSAKDIKSKLSWKVLEIVAKSDWDTLYAAITAKIITQRLKEEFWVDVEEKYIKDAHIKTVWAHTVNIVMIDWISASLKIEVIDSEEAKKRKEEESKKEEQKEEQKEDKSKEEDKKEESTEEK